MSFIHRFNDLSLSPIVIMKLVNAISLAAIQAATAKPTTSRSKPYLDVNRGAADAVPLERQLMSLSIEYTRQCTYM